MRKRMAVLALSSVLTFGTVSMVAAPHAVAQETPTQDDNGDQGLWGLAGLIGLAGLAGLRRKDDRRDTGYGGGATGTTR